MENRSTIRKVNQRGIMEYIIQQKGASRAEIAKALNLSKPAVSENVADLLEKGMLIESGIADSKVGKKGTLLQFNENHSCLMIIDLTGQLYDNAVSVSICNLNSIEQVTFHIPIKSYGISDLIEETHRQIQQSELDFDKVQVILVSVSGIVNSKEDNQACKETITPEGIQEQLEQGFGKPVVMYNDINLATLGEYYLSNQAMQNMAYLWIDLAIGGGFVLNGELYEGSIGAAGEIGSLKTAVLCNGKIQYANLSDVVSINAINETLKKEVSESVFLSSRLQETGTVSYEDLLEGKEKHDTYCVSYCKELVETMVRIVQDITYLLDLEYVVLGGHINLLGKEIYTAINEAFDSSYKKATVVVNPPLSENSALLGGYYYGVQKVMDLLFS